MNRLKYTLLAALFMVGFGVAGAFLPGRPLWWLLFVVTFIATVFGEWIQENRAPSLLRPPAKIYAVNPMTLDAFRWQLVREISDLSRPPDMARLKEFADSIRLPLDETIASLRSGSSSERAIAALASGRQDEAIRLFMESARAGQREAARNWFFLGSALFFADRVDEAAAALERSVHLDPDVARTWINWGTALKKLGRDEEAEEKFRKAAALGHGADPQD